MSTFSPIFQPLFKKEDNFSNNMKRQTSMSRPQAWLTYLFIFLLPTQLGTFFFISQSYIDGIRIDYLAPSLYMTDILIILLLFIPKREPIFFSKIREILFSRKIIFVGFLLILINIIFSLEPIITIFAYIKLAELWLIYFFIKQTPLLPKKILQMLLFSAGTQLLLVTLQIINHGSLQGIWYFLGERLFSLSTPGIAKISLQGIELMRGYGTFSHPNSLAGFYLLLYGFVSFYQPFDTYHLLRKIFLTIAIMLILFSFSKIAIIGLLGIMIYSGFKNKTNCFICRTSQLIVPIVLGAVFLSGVGDPKSLDKRLWLTASSLQIIQDHLFSGVGLRNYLIAQSTFSIPYPYFFLQPVHTIFLLAIAELGVPLFMLIVYLLKNTIQTIWKSPAGKAVIITVVFTGLFDHYWLTLQQNMLLIPVVFGLLQKHKSMVK